MIKIKASKKEQPDALICHCLFVRSRRLFPFRKQAMPFSTGDAIIGKQAFQNGRCHICFSSDLDKVETGYNLLME